MTVVATRLVRCSVSSPAGASSPEASLSPRHPDPLLERIFALTYWSRANEHGPAARAALNELSALAGSARTAVELREIAAEIHLCLVTAERAADQAARRAGLLTARSPGAEVARAREPVEDLGVPAVVRLTARPERH